MSFSVEAKENKINAKRRMRILAKQKITVRCSFVPFSPRSKNNLILRGKGERSELECIRCVNVSYLASSSQRLSLHFDCSVYSSAFPETCSYGFFIYDKQI